MFDFKNKKLIVNFDISHGIEISDGHERKEIIENKDQLINILNSRYESFSIEEIEKMKDHMGINTDYIIDKIIDNELKFQTARSGGKGGQNVNKVETKVQLFFNILECKYFDQNQKDKIINHSKKKQLHHDQSVLMFESQEERTQKQNKEIVIKKFRDFIHDALHEEKERIETDLPENENKKRLDSKRHHGKKKEYRAKPDLEE